MLAIVLACLAVAEAAPSCASGCDGKHTPVCGADGFTYHSACLAECQGVTIAAAGPCPKSQGGFLKAHTKQITQGDMDRFKNDGFRLMGSAKSGVFDPAQGEAIMAADAEKNRGKLAAAAATELETTSLRYTTDGLVYARKVQLSTATEAAPQPPTAPLEAENGVLEEDDKLTAAERKLLTIFGADNRVRVTTTGWPRSAGGRIAFSVGGLGYSCSGSMISSRTVLTAGHCVFDRDRQLWASGVTFSPNQLSATSKPYGTYSVQYLQTFVGWTNRANTNYWPYDFGALQLNDRTVGTRTGSFGLSIASGSYTQTLYTEGYPGDKPTGTYWQTSCSVRDTSRDGQIYTTCDVAGGQSGSPFFTSANYILGVISWASASTNGAAELTSGVWSTVLSWR